MRLRDEPFDSILKGEKTVELRLLDEKRRAIKAGDRIVFSRMDNSDDKFEVEVTKLTTAPSFVELFKTIDPSAGGWPVGTTAEQATEDMDKYYSREEQARYGVVGIEIQKI